MFLIPASPSFFPFFYLFLSCPNLSPSLGGFSFSLCLFLVVRGAGHPLGDVDGSTPPGLPPGGASCSLTFAPGLVCFVPGRCALALPCSSLSHHSALQLPGPQDPRVFVTPTAIPTCTELVLAGRWRQKILRGLSNSFDPSPVGPG